MPRLLLKIETSLLALLTAGCAGFFAFLMLSAGIGQRPARALPSFAVQTGQPCAACHVGAFGPQLKPYGRDFKLHGYTASDGKNHGLPITFTNMMSFTHTRDPQNPPPQGFGPNNNVGVDENSIYYAGRITSEIGAFIELGYSGVENQGGLGIADVRFARESELFGKDFLWGITANNGPTVADPWNSTPVWGFPYNSSGLAPTPMAATLVDGGLVQRVMGAGVYSLWNDLLYTEFDVYKGLGPRALQAVGQLPVEDGNQTTSFFPYGRIALIRDWEQHHIQVGAYAMTAKYLPGGDQTFGLRARATDLAVDGTYQFMFDSKTVTADMISAHATFIHEDNTIEPGGAALFATRNHTLNTFRADVSYSWHATITPTIQYFHTSGTPDASYWTTPTGSPNSSGMIYEVAYVPWGKPDSIFQNLNLRLAVQYVDYFRFDGSTVNARANNNWFFSVWTAIKF